MTTYRPFTGKAGLYPYSSAQINVPTTLANKIISWGKDHVKDKDVYSTDDMMHGREDEIHITLLYGIHSQLADEVSSLLSNQPSFEIVLGQISLFTTNENFDVLKVEANSSSLFFINYLLRTNVKNTPTYLSYKPHITVAYLNKGVYKEVPDKNHFKGLKWVANTIIFSSKNGEKTPIRLNTLKPVRCS